MLCIRWVNIPFGGCVSAVISKFNRMKHEVRGTKVIFMTLSLAIVVSNALDQPSTKAFDPDEEWYGDSFVGNDSDIQTQIDAQTKARYLLFPHIYRAFIDAGRTPLIYNVSAGCQKDLSRYYWALNKQKAWAWRLYDATGKQGAGLFHGALTWKGNFQECLNTLGYKTTNNFFTHDPDQPVAQYCSVFLQTPQWLKEAVSNLELPFPVPMPPFISDICVPDSCTEDDLSHVVQVFVTANSWGNMNFTVTDTRCFKGRHIYNDPAALCTATVLLVLCGFVAFGTLYDIYLRRRKLRIKHGSEFQIGYKKDTKQYGILKVILAAPPKSKLQRRYTVSGYEKIDIYKLQEIKVHRQNLLEHGSTSTLPGSSPTASDGSGHLAHGAHPFIQRSVSQPGDNTEAAHPPSTSEDKDEWLATVMESDSGESESDTSSVEETRTSSDEDPDTQAAGAEETKEPGEDSAGYPGSQEVRDKPGDPPAPLKSPTAGLEWIDEAEDASPWKLRGDGNEQMTLELKDENVTAGPTNGSNDVGGGELDDAVSPHLLNGSLKDIGDGTTDVDVNRGKEGKDQETEYGDVCAKPPNGNNNLPDSSRCGKSPLLTPDDSTDDSSPLISGKKPPPCKPVRSKAVAMLKALTFQHRSHSDPCICEKVKEETKPLQPLTLQPMEINVTETKSKGEDHKFDTKVPWSPSPKTVTHRNSPHGHVFERQMSLMTEDDPMAGLRKEDHKLYAIPEETQEGKENGGILIPEIEIKVRDRPMVKATAVGFLRGLLLSFSFRRSTKRVMAEGSTDTLFCLNGVRVLSISWIVLGSVYMILYLNPDVVDNHVDGVKLTQTLWVQAVINTTLAADSFYILSGTLGAYNFMKLKKKFKGKKMWEVMTIKEYFMLMFHRLCRIGPCYWLVLFLFTNLMPYMGKGPRWSYEITSVDTCKQKWWANALFFSNFYQSDRMCMPHTYYLVNDFQFALVSPLFLIPLLCKPVLGFIMLGGLVVLQIVSTLILDHGINGNVLRMQETDYFSSIYVKPYCRIGVYAIGLGLGYLLWCTKRQMKFKKIPLISLWLLSLTIVFTLPFITHLENKVGGRNWTGVETALYEALSRPLWGLALAWIIFACSTGQGAFVNKLLSWNAFLPLCRITYGVYLLHPMLIAVVIESRQNGIYIDFPALTYEFVASLVVSYLLAFVLITFVECPFTTLESNIRAHLGHHKYKKKH